MNTVLMLTVTGLPSRCPSCGHQCGSWPLSTHLGQLTVTCPECHLPLSQVMAAPPRTDPLVLAAREAQALDQPVVVSSDPVGYAICPAHPDGCVNYPENEQHDGRTEG